MSELRLLSELAELSMGETIIQADCDGEGYPIYSADTSDSPWNWSSKIKKINKSGTIVVGARGSIGFPRLPKYESFGATQTTITLVPDRSLATSKYLFHALSAFDFRKVTLQQAVPMLTVGELGASTILCPPVSQQIEISKILDVLDTAIQETEAIIAKLKAVKQGLLHDLLTRGIDANGELRPSQAEAPHLYKDSPLGWIPKEWDALRLEEITDLQVGFAFKSEWFLDAGKTRLLRGDNVGYGCANWDATKFLSENSVDSYIEYMLKAGDVVVGMDRTFTKTGAKFSVIKSDDLPCLLVQRVGRFVPKLCSMPFLRLLTMWSRFHSELLAQQKGMDIPHLSKKEILSPFVPKPTEREQALSCEKIISIEGRLSFESNFMYKLKALKSALMDDLLTGRVRVTPLLTESQHYLGDA